MQSEPLQALANLLHAAAHLTCALAAAHNQRAAHTQSHTRPPNDATLNDQDARDSDRSEIKAKATSNPTPSPSQQETHHAVQRDYHLHESKYPRQQRLGAKRGHCPRMHSDDTVQGRHVLLKSGCPALQVQPSISQTRLPLNLPSMLRDTIEEGHPHDGGGDSHDGGDDSHDGGGDSHCGGDDSHDGGGDPDDGGGDPHGGGGDFHAEGGDPKNEGGDRKNEGDDPKTEGDDPNTEGGDTFIHQCSAVQNISCPRNARVYAFDRFGYRTSGAQVLEFLGDMDPVQVRTPTFDFQKSKQPNTDINPTPHLWHLLTFFFALT